MMWNRVHELCDKIKAEIKGPCSAAGEEKGYQVAVAVADRLQTPSSYHYADLDAITEKFAKQLHDACK